MNAGTVTRASRRYAMGAEHARSITAFASIGWTADQWIDTYDALDTTGDTPGAIALTAWLRRTPGPSLKRLVVPLTPAMVLELLERHGKQTLRVLGGLTAGASERFAVIYLERRWNFQAHQAAGAGWRYALSIGLAEPQAVGWAGTGYLNPGEQQLIPNEATTLNQWERTLLVRSWIRRFGPSAWLYVLAGFTLDEAIALRTAGQSPTGQQLRVMVALAGHTLPADL